MSRQSIMSQHSSGFSMESKGDLDYNYNKEKSSQTQKQDSNKKPKIHESKNLPIKKSKKKLKLKNITKFKKAITQGQELPDLFANPEFSQSSQKRDSLINSENLSQEDFLHLFKKSKAKIKRIKPLKPPKPQKVFQFKQRQPIALKVRWTPEEDTLFKKCIIKYGYDYDKILSVFPHYDLNRIKNRLYQMRKETVKTKNKFGPEIEKILLGSYSKYVNIWSKQEHCKFVELYKTHGKDYSKISEELLLKSPLQVEEYAATTRIKFARLPLDHPERKELACINLCDGDDLKHLDMTTPRDIKFKTILKGDENIQQVLDDIQEVLSRQMEFIIQEAEQLQLIQDQKQVTSSQTQSESEGQSMEDQEIEDSQQDSEQEYRQYSSFKKEVQIKGKYKNEENMEEQNPFMMGEQNPFVIQTYEQIEHSDKVQSNVKQLQGDQMQMKKGEDEMKGELRVETSVDQHHRESMETLDDFKQIMRMRQQILEKNKARHQSIDL